MSFAEYLAGQKDTKKAPPKKGAKIDPKLRKTAKQAMIKERAEKY